MPMKAIVQAIRKHRTLVFFDLEATQFSHEMTEIAAIKVIVKEDGSIKKVFKPFHYYVIPKNHVGSHVAAMTGLTDEFLLRNGVPFRVVQKGLIKYLGKEYKEALFVCYGNQDGEIFENSAANNMDASMDEALFVKHHCFDFLRFLSRYVTGEDGNPINLGRAMEVFGFEMKGKAHTATTDAYAVLSLYEAFFRKKEILAREYGKTISRGKGVPEPLRLVLKRLERGEAVTPDDFTNLIMEALQ